MAQPFLLRWRSMVLSDAGPATSGARFVLLALSTYMDSDGASCFPSIETLAQATQLSDKTVRTHLAAAERVGWITRELRGRNAGQAWKGYEYAATLPKGAVIVTGPVAKGAVIITGRSNKGPANTGEGAVNGTQKVRQPLPTISPVELSNNSTTGARSPSANGASDDSQKVVAHLNELLTSHHFPGVQDWGAARKIATSALRRVPVQEALGALTWAFQNDFWRKRFAAEEVKVLKGAWADWLERDKEKVTPIRKGATYVDTALNGPQFKLDSPLLGGT